MFKLSVRQLTTLVLVFCIALIPAVRLASVGTGNCTSPNYIELHSCELSPGLCPDGATCVNTVGSYYCVCAPGFKLDTDGETCEDINECTEVQGYCHENATCTNTAPWANCECKEGYEGNGHSCRDIDECASVPCDEFSECHNEPGSYSCTCMEGYYEDNDTCVRQCPADDCVLLHEMAPHTSGPVDHCQSASCSSDAICVNEEDSYRCACPPGYVMNEEATQCVDIDECALGIHDCDVPLRASCTNTAASYLCNCNPNSEGDGHFCNMTSTCDHYCGEAQFCLKLSFRLMGFPITVEQCECQSGYTASDSGCVIDNKCKQKGWCHENATCELLDTAPYIKCTCDEGFEGNGKHCTDVNECAVNGTCDENAICINTLGSHMCVCKYGYTGDGQTCSLICPETDECLHGTHHCHEMATCIDTPVSYKCTCQAGYTGSGYHCEPMS